MTSRRSWFSPALKGDATGFGGDSDEEPLNRRGENQHAGDDPASSMPPTATRTDKNDLAERGLPEFKDQMRAVQAGPIAGATAPYKQKPRGDDYDSDDGPLALPVATPFVSAIPQYQYQRNTVIARPDDLADRVQHLERELAAAAATRPNNKRRHDERSGAAATTPLITRSVLVIILVAVIVTAGVAAGTAIALTNRKSPDHGGGGDDEDPSIRPSVENPSTRRPSATPVMRVTATPSRPPTKSPTIDPDKAIRASIDPAFIANLQSDGRHTASAETLATISAIYESNITIPVTSVRQLFNEEIAGQWHRLGYNAVIVYNDGLPRAQGHDMALSYTHCCENLIVSTNFTLFVGTRDHPMIVENRGERGFPNWLFFYNDIVYWVRYGTLVFFLPTWDNDLFGEPRVERDRSEFPGWFI